MAEVTETFVDDIGLLQQFTVGNTVTNLRVQLDMYSRRIITLQSRIISLQAEEQSIKSRALNNVDLSYIDRAFGAGKNTNLNSTQAIDEAHVSKDPHQNIGYDKFQIYSKIDSIKDLQRDMNRIDAEIMELQALIRDYQKSQKDIEAMLQTIEQEQQTKLANKAAGRTQQPTYADVEKDRIARSRSADINNIYTIHTAYRNFSVTDPEKGTRGYPDGDAKITQKLMRYKQEFWAAAQNFPSLLSSADPSKRLDLIDPGSDNNATILSTMMGIIRGAAANDKTIALVDKYVRDLTTITNNTIISKGIGRKPIPVASSENSMREMTKSYPVAVMSLGKDKNGVERYVGNFNLPSLSSSVLKWWKGKNALYDIGLPPCEGQTWISENAAVARNKAQAEAESEMRSALGRKLYKESLSTAEKSAATPVKVESTSTPPGAQESDAPTLIS
jgi:cell fate (sporulation/competence/biofilm development) regulator YmcA (YheA/YmcA/DUF963 family)